MTKAKLFTFVAAGLVSLAHTACTKSAKTAVSPDQPEEAQGGSDDASASAPSEDVEAICRGADPIAHAKLPAAAHDGGSLGMPVIGVLASPERRYTIADLQALQRKGQYEELLQHIEDIPPGKRGADWDALLEKSATGLLAKYNRDEDNSDWGDFMMAEILVQRYPQLAKKKDFMAKRGKIGTAVIERCLEQSYSGEECLGLARDFIGVQGTDPDVVLAVAKTVRGKQNADVAVPFFLTALEAGKDTACGDEDLELATRAGLALPPDYDRAAAAREIAQNKCFAVLQAPIVDALEAGDAGSYFTANACAVLRAKGVVK